MRLGGSAGCATSASAEAPREAARSVPARGAVIKADAFRYRRHGISGPGPNDLRASDAGRDLVIKLLSEAAADGRLTMSEHAKRSEQALAARTLGDLTRLTADLALPAGQPIKLYPRR